MRPSGHKEVLGLWIEQSEGAKFWLRVMNEIKGRGTHDILIAVVDSLKGFPDAITAVFPDTVVQTCIVHLLRYSMQFAPIASEAGVVGTDTAWLDAQGEAGEPGVVDLEGRFRGWAVSFASRVGPMSARMGSSPECVRKESCSVALMSADCNSHSTLPWPGSGVPERCRLMPRNKMPYLPCRLLGAIACR